MERVVQGRDSKSPTRGAGASAPTGPGGTGFAAGSRSGYCSLHWPLQCWRFTSPRDHQAASGKAPIEDAGRKRSRRRLKYHPVGPKFGRLCVPGGIPAPKGRSSGGSGQCDVAKQCLSRLPWRSRRGRGPRPARSPRSRCGRSESSSRSTPPCAPIWWRRSARDCASMATRRAATSCSSRVLPRASWNACPSLPRTSWRSRWT